MDVIAYSFILQLTAGVVHLRWDTSVSGDSIRVLKTPLTVILQPE